MDLQTYQNDHIDEVEIISLPKKCNNTGAKTDQKQVQRQVQRFLGAHVTFFKAKKRCQSIVSKS